jgi:3-hydroxybutyryl-CoA dehydratase
MSAQTKHGDFHGLRGYYFEELTVGMEEVFSRTITDTDIKLFSGVSGDTNPMHLNEEYARSTPFGGCIVYGMLTASLISAVIGTKLPGPGCIYMNQSLKFTAPVRVGDTVYAVVRVKELFPDKKRALMDTKCYVHDTMVIDGEALIKVPSKPA